MEIDKFLNLLKETLELESANLTLNTNIQELDEWDSMTGLILIDVVSKEFDLILDADELVELTTIQSLINLIGADKFRR